MYEFQEGNGRMCENCFEKKVIGERKKNGLRMEEMENYRMKKRRNQELVQKRSKFYGRL